MWDPNNHYKTLAGKIEQKRSFGTLWCRWENLIATASQTGTSPTEKISKVFTQ
jgi:hypothetical protein